MTRGPEPSQKWGSAEGQEVEQGPGTNAEGLQDGLPPSCLLPSGTNTALPPHLNATVDPIYRSEVRMARFPTWAKGEGGWRREENPKLNRVQLGSHWAQISLNSVPRLPLNVKQGLHLRRPLKLTGGLKKTKE